MYVLYAVGVLALLSGVVWVWEERRFLRAIIPYLGKLGLQCLLIGLACYGLTFLPADLISTVPPVVIALGVLGYAVVRSIDMLNAFQHERHTELMKLLEEIRDKRLPVD